MGNETVTMIPTTSGHFFKVCCAGYFYHYQKELGGGSHCWKCSMERKAMAFRGFLQTDTKGPGMRGIAQGATCDGCDPSPPTERAEATHRQIIRAGKRVAAPRPQRILAGSLGELVYTSFPPKQNGRS